MPEGITLMQGDARHLPMADQSVHCVVTSPPYWSLRDYGLAPTVWGGDATHTHVWAACGLLRKRGQPIASSMAVEHGPARIKTAKAGEQCGCGAWRGVLGLEPTVGMFIQHLVEVFDEVKRVLRDDGTAWVNIGDCYDSASKQRWLVPHRLALALQDAGWIVRSDIIWAKGVSFCPSYAGSVMPESVRDRPTCAHEHVLMLAKHAKYYYDYEAVREPGRVPGGTRAAKGSGTREGNRRPADYAIYDGKRNPRDVWTINTKPFTEAHFATFPPALVEPILRAGAPRYVCRTCQMPYRHVVERSPVPTEIQAALEEARGRTRDVTGRSDGHTSYKPAKNYQRRILADSYQPSCRCVDRREPVEGTSETLRATLDESGRQGSVVLDPFCGSATVGVVCQRAGLRFIGVDASATYLETIAAPRLQRMAALAAQSGGRQELEPTR